MVLADFKAANMVMVAHLTEPLHLRTVYHALPVVHIPNFVFGTKVDDGSRSKIPYFGEENIVVSVRYEMNSRGVRNTGGQIKNVVAVDLQINQKNIHMKISEQKILLAGATSTEMGNQGFTEILKHIQMANEHLTYLQQLDPEVLDQSIDWIASLLYDQEIKEPDRINNPEVKLAMEATSMDVRAITWLSMFNHEHATKEQFLEKVKILVTGQPCYLDRPTVQDSIIYNSVYLYTIQKEPVSIRLIRTAEGLVARNYLASYHNFRDKSIKVFIPLFKRKNKVYGHRFCVYRNGTIRQNSPTQLPDALAVATKLVADILEINDPAASLGCVRLIACQLLIDCTNERLIHQLKQDLPKITQPELIAILQEVIATPIPEVILRLIDVLDSILP